jgi:integrase
MKNEIIKGLKLDGQNWTFSYRIGGKSRRMKLGEAPGVVPADARKAASILAGQVACGRCPSTERKASRQREVADAAPIRDGVEKTVRAYLKHHHARVRESTYRESARVMAKEILPSWRGRRLSEVTRQDIRTLIDKIAARPAPISANRALATVKTFFAFAVEQDLISISPAAAIKPPAPEVARERCLDDSELAAVWRASQELGEYGSICRLLILTGARRSEVANMTWQELDLPGKVWTLPAARAKNGRQHTIPLSEQAIAVLASIAATFGRPNVFEPQSFSRCRGVLNAIVRDRTMPPWTLHDLRRTAASGMAALGTAPHVVESVLNHRSGVIRGVAAVYNRYSYSTEKRTALDLWGSHVVAISLHTAAPVEPSAASLSEAA